MLEEVRLPERKFNRNSSGEFQQEIVVPIYWVLGFRKYYTCKIIIYYSHYWYNGFAMCKYQELENGGKKRVSATLSRSLKFYRKIPPHLQ